MEPPIEIFFSYSHKDEVQRDELAKQLIILERQGYITLWHDQRIVPGQQWADQIDNKLNTAHIILLLISPDFIASDYCYGIEMARAMERHEQGEAIVIPIILRPVHWKEAPFGKLEALPKNAKPVKNWQNEDEAFFNIAEGIRKVVIELRTNSSLQQTIMNETAPTGTVSSESIEEAHIEGLGDVVSLGNPEVFYISSDTLLTSLEPNHQIASLPLGEVIFKHNVFFGEITNMAWSPDGTCIATTCRDGYMRVRNAIDGTPVIECTFSYEIINFSLSKPLFTSVAWAPNGRYVATATSYGAIHIFDVTKSNDSEVVEAQYNDKGVWIRDLAWAPDGNSIAFISSPEYASDHITVKSFNTDNVIAYHGHHTRPNAFAWAPNSERIASAASKVHVWDASGGSLVHTFPEDPNQINAVVWSPNGKYVAFASNDNIVYVYNTHKGVRELSYDKHLRYRLWGGNVKTVAWSPDEKYIASGGTDRTVHVWKPLTGETIATYQHNKAVSMVTWSSDGQRLATIGDGDNKVHMWRAVTNEDLVIDPGHTDKILGFAWSPDGTKIASYAKDNTVQVWQAI